MADIEDKWFTELQPSQFRRGREDALAALDARIDALEQGIPIDTAGLDDLADVDTTTTPPVEGDVLGWDEVGQKWIPLTLGDLAFLNFIGLSLVSDAGTLAGKSIVDTSDLEDGAVTHAKISGTFLVGAAQETDPAPTDRLPLQKAGGGVRYLEIQHLPGGAEAVADYDLVDWDTDDEGQGAALTAAPGKRYQVTGSANLTVTWDGASFADERTAVVELLSSFSGALAHQAASGFTLNGATGTDTQHNAVCVFVRDGTDFTCRELLAGEEREDFTHHGGVTFEGQVNLKAGVQVPNGSAVSGTLTMAEHGGGIYVTSDDVTVTPAAGFAVTLKLGGAHTVGAGGDAHSGAAGDVVSVICWSATNVSLLPSLAADVVTLPVS